MSSVKHFSDDLCNLDTMYLYTLSWQVSSEYLMRDSIHSENNTHTARHQGLLTALQESWQWHPYPCQLSKHLTSSDHNAGASDLHYSTFSRSTDVTSPTKFRQRWKQRKCIVVIVVLIVLFWCGKDYNVVSVYWNIVRWGCDTISINWVLFSPLPKLDQLRGCDVSWPREWLHMIFTEAQHQ